MYHLFSRVKYQEQGGDPFVLLQALPSPQKPKANITQEPNKAIPCAMKLFTTELPLEPDDEAATFTMK